MRVVRTNGITTEGGNVGGYAREINEAALLRRSHNARFLPGRPMTLLVATGRFAGPVVDVDESTWNAPAPQAGVCHNSVILDF